MSEKKNTDLKDDRLGFGMSSQKRDDDDPEYSNIHPGWPEFIKMYSPAPSKTEATKLLTTSQVLDTLDSICLDDYCSEADLFHCLKENNFILHPVPGTDIHLWLLKAAVL